MLEKQDVLFIQFSMNLILINQQYCTSVTAFRVFSDEQIHYKY